MHIYSKDQQAFHLTRTLAEKWLSRINTLVVACQLGCYLAAFIRTGMTASNSMNGSLFSSGPLELDSAFYVPGCVYPVEENRPYLKSVTYNMTPDNIDYFVSLNIANLRTLLGICGTHVALSLINRVWFEVNTHEVRYHFVVFNKDMVTAWEIIFMIIGFILNMQLTGQSRRITDYLKHCSEDPQSIRGYFCTAPPYVELYASLIFSMVVTGGNLIIAGWNLLKENPKEALLKEERERLAEWRRLLGQDEAGNGEGLNGGAVGGPGGAAAPGDGGAANVDGFNSAHLDDGGQPAGGQNPHAWVEEWEVDASPEPLQDEPLEGAWHEAEENEYMDYGGAAEMPMPDEGRRNSPNLASSSRAGTEVLLNSRRGGATRMPPPPPMAD